MSSISDWFSNRSVFVTGGTGFMGKILISKLLLSCPNIADIFIVIRKKKGVDPQTRWHLIMQEEPFRILREQYPERLKKLVVLTGDTSIKGLSLSAEKERFISRVSVVFHMAANVRFDLPLKTAIRMNTMGTMNVVALAKQMPLLESFIHMSTTFCQCGELVLEERPYQTSISAESVARMIDTMTDEALEAMRPQLLTNQPNTYAYSKALSEDFVSRCGLPVGIIRPSIVAASWKEPVPGWIDNMNGPTGLLIGAGKGVIRSMLCNANYLINMVPCDMAINATIAFAWRVGSEKCTKPMFLNVTMNKENQISWGDALEIGKKHLFTNPFSQPLWYPGGRITSSKILHWFAVLLLHIIPAYLLDALLIVTGNKPFLVRVQNRVSSGLELLQYYTMKQWNFLNDNLRDLQTQLCSSDRETFFMDTKVIRWDEYMLSYILGTRQYYLKDDPSTLPRARRVFFCLYVADCLLKTILASFVIWIMYSWMMSAQLVTTTLLETNERTIQGASTRHNTFSVLRRPVHSTEARPSPRPSSSTNAISCADSTLLTHVALVRRSPRPLLLAVSATRKRKFLQDQDLVTMEQSKIDDVAPDRIAETFVGRRILVTGGTGFLGKVLIEKFLRCLPDIAQIYMLIRPKKGKDPKHRLEEIFDSPLFETVKAQRGLSALHKAVTIVSGDVLLPGLGLSVEDRKMLCDNVDIVYHGAATVRFDELLKRAVLLNTRGTKQMLELAKEMKHLLLFTHISTAYCHLEEKILGERTYPPPANPHQVIKCVEWMDDDVVEAMTDKILGKVPNTYAFTKALSESLVEESMPHIPSIILRPSVVIPVWKDPLPGWTDNINGPTGLLIGAGKGVIRTMYCNKNGYADYLPVDIAVNAILITTWNFIYFKDYEKRVYNLTSSNEFKISWEEIIERGRKITQRVPLNGIVWYPGGSMKNSRLLHNICVLFFHMLPAYFIDTILFFLGYKPIMCRVHRRIQKGFEVFEYYANNQWDFVNTHALDVREKLNSTEYKTYQIHGTDMDIDAYFEECIRAARIYILKEMPETLPAARRHLRVMYWVDVFTKILFFLLLIYLLASWSESFRALLASGSKYVMRALK
ncbi:Putative fatty acyl-CoA reductase [Ooceraea biroi]|uniref:Fatty acyl-CoA reductase n=1 Tax=Ooceraea biroi TaxID=2015173 RepID=A0A026WY93_OOCBI|nr:Putative fatty acyl-CoA reductase [Ooceraea biroi]